MKEDLEDAGIPFKRDVPVGTMIEVPSAALMADVLAQEVDFFSIGTNDLIQYTLAADRNNEHVARPVQPGGPGRSAADPDGGARPARRNRIEVNVCGEMSGEPLYTPLLVGLGLRQLSATPRKIPEIKRVIRDTDGRRGGAARRARPDAGNRPPGGSYLRDQLRRTSSPRRRSIESAAHRCQPRGTQTAVAVPLRSHPLVTAQRGL